MLEIVWAWLTEKILILGYPGIFGLMALESSFFPFPSEVVMPPGGANAKAGAMSLLLVILSGIGGSLAGALFNYWFASRLGRPFFLRYGRYVLVSRRRFVMIEGLFRRHGEIATFIGRLVPGVRQVISFPAGLARMDLTRFCLFTALGSGIWVTVLALIGYLVGTDLAVVNRTSHHVLLWMLPGVLLLLALYVWWYRRWRTVDPGPAGEEPAE